MEVKMNSRYYAYKDSGVEWLAEIPEHWDVGRIKQLAWFKYGDSLSSDSRESGNVPVYGSNGQVGNHSCSNTHAPCIIIGRKGSYGKVNYSTSNCFAIDTTFFVDDTTTKCDIRWLYYCLSIVGLDTYSQDSAVPGLSRDYAHNLWLPKIPPSEQRAIADFLDRETARIDALISKYQRLIELLEEKRTSLISQAVTKGLNLSVPMMDTKIPWLGKIPIHWEIKQIKHVVQINPETLPENTSPNYTIQYLDISNIDKIGGIGINQEFLFADAPSRARRIVRAGDTIISTVRTYLKAVAFFENPLENQVVSTGFAVLRSKTDVYPKFLKWFVLSKEFIERVVAHSVGVGYPAINPSELASLPIWIPTYEEQFNIASFLDRETLIIDSSILKIRKIITKLQEYRTALISAAVTGKIDVTQ